ncbi:HdeD family acid-resistance protein [Gulosibacter sp. 10]|uniref:HdeD family acid-resistance protein n=1 Tax=Gulosibacter sp. 10 TaxID=1255570 RepID=UPI00097EAD53|nr:DUF308 domain-containing protein [Gulosibacter sp. 10]SJM59409.1 Probable conserved membrane protein [Gulosibacter sp. 10]
MARTSSSDSTRKTVRGPLVAAGVLAAITGLLILLWPAQTAAVIPIIIAVYALLTGIVYLIAGFTNKTHGTGLRAAHILLGILFVAASVVTFLNLGLATSLLAVFIGVALGVTWIFEAIAAFIHAAGLPKRTSGRRWSFVYAVISLLAGIGVIMSPFLFALWMWLFVGISLLFFGVVNTVRALSMNSNR